ncbi:MAG: hypothetical protein K5930_05825 [Treponemataceae bacterium]|nr:hypothetical protein [Treponemataceae bacterium]
MKKLIFFLLLFTALSSVVAVPKLTDRELEIIKKITDDRIDFSCMPVSEALSKSIQYRTDILEHAEKNNFSEQAKLIIDNMTTVEVHTHLYEKDIKNPELKGNVTPRIKKAADWIEDHKEDSGISAYMYYTTADIISCGLSFMSLGDILSYGLKIKDFYIEAVELDPTCSMAYSGLAQWYYYAPGLSGGSTKKAYTNFELSLKHAYTRGEKFTATIFMSQSLYDQKKYTEARKLLEDADKMLPGSRLVSYMKKLNDADYCYFYYVVNREKVEKKLGYTQ